MIYSLIKDIDIERLIVPNHTRSYNEVVNSNYPRIQLMSVCLIRKVK